MARICSGKNSFGLKKQMRDFVLLKQEACGGVHTILKWPGLIRENNATYWVNQTLLLNGHKSLVTMLINHYF